MINERIKYLKASIKSCELKINGYGRYKIPNKHRKELLEECKNGYKRELQWLEQLKEKIKSREYTLDVLPFVADELIGSD